MRLAAAFPRDHVPESTITLYRSKLEHLDAALMANVIETAITNATKFPTIADLRQDYLREYTRHQEAETPALPLGRSPMPDSLKKQLAEMHRKFDDRATEIETE